MTRVLKLAPTLRRGGTGFVLCYQQLHGLVSDCKHYECERAGEASGNERGGGSPKLSAEAEAEARRDKPKRTWRCKTLPRLDAMGGDRSSSSAFPPSRPPPLARARPRRQRLPSTGMVYRAVRALRSTKRSFELTGQRPREPSRAPSSPRPRRPRKLVAIPSR